MFTSFCNNDSFSQALERSKLSDALNEKEFSHGEKIISQGEVGNEMYFILDGEVRIVRTNDHVSLLSTTIQV